MGGGIVLLTLRTFAACLFNVVSGIAVEWGYGGT